MTDQPKKRGSYQKLQMAQTIKCSDWLRQNWEAIRTERPTVYETAAKMSAALGFTVPVGSIPTLVKALGFEWHTGRRTSPSSKTKMDRPRVLGRILRTVLEKLGEEVPDELNEICDCKGLLAAPAAADQSPTAKLFAV